MEQRVIDYLKSERQWTRQCRIDRARLELAWGERYGVDDKAKRFWHEVIFRLTGSER